MLVVAFALCSLSLSSLQDHVYHNNAPCPSLRMGTGEKAFKFNTVCHVGASPKCGLITR